MAVRRERTRNYQIASEKAEAAAGICSYILLGSYMLREVEAEQKAEINGAKKPLASPGGN
eukprot:2203584-Pleurochrysis_carterae.AAC.1